MIHLLWLSLAIPIVVHLVHRRRAKRVSFSTLRFLQMVDHRIARRERLKELLLLAARLFLLAALIAALYRPMIHSSTFRGADVPTAAVVLLDNTYSMRTVAGSSSRFEQARRAALDVVRGMRRGDSAGVVAFDPAAGATQALTTDLGRVREALDSAECGYGSAALADALRQAVGELRAASAPRKELYIITDFQRLCWTPALAEIKEAFPADLPVFLVDVGGPTETNLAVTGARFELNVQVVGANSDLRCTLRNWGLREARKEASLFLDGEKVAGQTVSLGPGAEQTVLFAPLLRRAGDVAGQVQTDADQLDADNAFYFTVPVREKVPVLLVDGAPSAVPYRDAAFFLDLALRAPPEPTEAGRSLSPIRVQMVTPDEAARQRLEDYACVVLANVPLSPEQWRDRLVQYVTGGGGLVIFAGDRVDAASYNETLAPSGGPALLPAPLGEIREHGSGPGLGMKPTNPQHPIFQGVLNDLDTSAVHVTRFLTLAGPLDPSAGPVLAETNEGPLLLEKKVGAGTVVLCTTGADLDWSSLPATPVFLPLLHQIVYYVSHPPRESHGVSVGMPCVLDIPATHEPVAVSVYAPVKSGAASEDAPVATLTTAEEDGVPRAVFRRTGRPGIYRAVWSLDGVEQTRLFAVNVESRESAPDRVEPDEAARMLGGVVRIVSDPAELASVVRRDREGLPIWNYLFALALLAVLAEAFLGNVLLDNASAQVENG